MTQTKKWSLLTALLIVGLFVASWFLLISPERGKAADLREQTVSQEQANQQLQTKIAMLQAQAKDLPKQQALLAQIVANLPADPQLPTLIRSLTSAAGKSGMDLVSLAPSTPVAMTEVTGAAAQAGSTTLQAPAGTSASGRTLYQIPVVLNANGNYFEAVAFLNKLEGLKRSFLVTGVTVGGGSSSAGASGTAASGASAPGDVDITINGRVFMSAPSTPQAPAGATPAPAAAPAK